MSFVCEKCLKEHDEMEHPYTRGYRSGYLAGMRQMRDIVDDVAVSTRIYGNSQMSLKRIPMLTQKAVRSWRDLINSDGFFVRWNSDKRAFEIECEQRGYIREGT